MKVNNCPICGNEPTLKKNEMWEGTHGYYGNYSYLYTCERCKLVKSDGITDIYTTPLNAQKLAIKNWNKLCETYNKWFKLKENRK